MVEYYVRDVGAAGSNPVTSTILALRKICTLQKSAINSGFFSIIRSVNVEYKKSVTHLCLFNIPAALKNTENETLFKLGQWYNSSASFFIYKLIYSVCWEICAQNIRKLRENVLFRIVGKRKMEELL